MRVVIDLWYDMRPTASLANMKPFKATLIDVLPAWQDIPPETIQAYYGGPAGEPPPKNASDRFVVPRNIYKKDNGGYVVLPMTARNKHCIKELNE